MSEFNGVLSQRVKLEYDEDEKVEVKYEPFDSDLETNIDRDPVPTTSTSKSSCGIQESVIQRCDWGCVTCRNIIEKINEHLNLNICPSSNDTMGGSVQTEPPGFIVDNDSFIKNEPEEDFVKSEPLDVNSDPGTEGTPASGNSGQKQCKTHEFDTGLWKPGCKFCEKRVQTLKNHLKLNHPQLQSQPTYDSDISTDSTSTQKSAVLGPLRTIDFTSAEAHRFRYSRNFRKPVDETNTRDSKDVQIKKRTTQTSMRAGYPEEAIPTQPRSSDPLAKTCHPNSDRSCHRNTGIHSGQIPRTKTHGQNSESKSEGSSWIEIQENLDNSESTSNSVILPGGNVVCSAPREEKLKEYARPHTGGKSEGMNETHTGESTEKTPAVCKSVGIDHALEESPELAHFGKISAEVTHTHTDTKILMMTNPARKPENIAHTVEESPKLHAVRQKWGQRSHVGVETAQLTHTVENRRVMIERTDMTRTGKELTELSEARGQRDNMTRTDHSITEQSTDPGTLTTATASCTEEHPNFQHIKEPSAEKGINHLSPPEAMKQSDSECRKIKDMKIQTSKRIISPQPGCSDARLKKTRSSYNRRGKSPELIITGQKLTKRINPVGELADMTYVGEKSGGAALIGEESDNVTNSVEESASIALIGGKPANIARTGEKLDNTTSTVVKSSELIVNRRKRTTIVHAGENLINMNRLREKSGVLSRTASEFDKLSYTGEKVEKLTRIRGAPAKTVLNVGDLTKWTNFCGKLRMKTRVELVKLSDTEEKNLMSTRIRGIPPRLTQSGELRGMAVPTDGKPTNKALAQERRQIYNNQNASLYSCKKCNRKCSTREELQRHMRRNHTQDKKFKCGECQKRFMTKCTLTIHKRIHTGVKPFTCDTCAKSFAQKGNLIFHMTIHTKERPFKCDICEKNFKRADQLKLHKGNHSEEKPFKCTVCEKGCVSKSRLTLHEKTHDKVKEFQCSKCEKSFIKSHQLAYHNLSHVAEKVRV